MLKIDSEMHEINNDDLKSHSLLPVDCPSPIKTAKGMGDQKWPSSISIIQQ